MFKSKKANIVLALLIAISLWAYVTGSVNPEVTKKFVNIPIKFVNEDSLSSNGLAIESIENSYVDVTISGTRTDVNDIDAEDIKVVADMYNRNKGNNYVPIEVDLPKGIELDSKSIDKVHVVIGELTTREYEIQVDTGTTMEKGMALANTEIIPGKTVVMGTENNLNSIDRVVARLDARQVSENPDSYRCDVEAINRNGGKVNFVLPEIDKVTVNTKLVARKKVPLKVNVVGKPAEGYEMEDIDMPTNVFIVGSKEVLEDIDKIKAKDINIEGLSESKTFKLEFDLPKGVHLDAPDKLTVEVNIDAPKEKTFVLEPGRVEVLNLKDGFTAEVLDSVRVTIKGNKNIIEDVVRENIIVTVDAKGLEEGEHQVKVVASFKNETRNDNITFKLDKNTVDIRIVKM